MLEIQHLCGGYPGNPVLQDVSLTAKEGQITAVIGPNGCGKSTLLKTLCGIIPPNNGLVLLNGAALLSLPRQRLSQQVAYLAQSSRIPDITVRRMVLHGRFPYLSYPRHYRPEDETAAALAIDRMGLTELADTPLDRLSGGQRQKVHIAMALAQNTPVLLLDEPTTYLDISHQLQLLRLARELAEDGKHILMVIHDLSHGLEAADQVVLMHHGAVVLQDTPEAVCRSGALQTVFGIGVCQIETEHGPRYYYQDTI